MRFVVDGAGAIGGVVGARLAQSGQRVALIARGAHHDAIAADVLRLLVDEAEACFAAAGIDVATPNEDQARRGDRLKFIDLPGHRYRGGSSWQSATRGTGNPETDYLNGETVLLGRTHAVPVPANATVCRLAAQVAQGSLTACSLQPDELLSHMGG